MQSAVLLIKYNVKNRMSNRLFRCVTLLCLFYSSKTVFFYSSKDLVSLQVMIYD